MTIPKLLVESHHGCLQSWQAFWVFLLHHIIKLFYSVSLLGLGVQFLFIEAIISINSNNGYVKKLPTFHTISCHLNLTVFAVSFSRMKGTEGISCLFSSFLRLFDLINLSSLTNLECMKEAVLLYKWAFDSGLDQTILILISITLLTVIIIIVVIVIRILT